MDGDFPHLSELLGAFYRGVGDVGGNDSNGSVLVQEGSDAVC